MDEWFKKWLLEFGKSFGVKKDKIEEIIKVTEKELNVNQEKVNEKDYSQN